MKNKFNLELRHEILKAIRKFFDINGFVELEAPIIVRLPGQEVNLSPMKLDVSDEKGQKFEAYLHTSPEYAMKKALSAGFNKIFYLGKCFRNRESFGGSHNPEFTMLEWYRAGENYFSLMDDTEHIFKFVADNVAWQGVKNEKELSLIKGTWQRKSMKELWQEYLELDLDEYLTQEKMFELSVQRGYNLKKEDSFEDIFYTIFLNEIETKLGFEAPIFVYDYPRQMASLSRLSAKDSRYAERFELYFNGLEMCNAFSELIDASEQKQRLTSERQQRGNNNMEVFDVDEEFITAIKAMPPAAGNALGVDRLIMGFLSCQNIDDVLVLPMSKLFN